MAAAWAAAAALSAQPACADPPSTTTAVDAWVTVREWVDRMAVPPNAGSPEGVAAAAVVLRLDGRPVGVGTSHEKGSSLPRAVAQAIERVRQDRVIEGLSTKEQDAVGRRLTMELELAGPAAPMVGRTVPEVGQRVEPALGALSMRRNDRWAWTYPSVLQAGNMAGDATAILAALLRELDVDASELPTLELPASMAFYMAPTVRLAQQAPTRPPFEVVRGNEVVPLTALGPAGRQEFAAAMARHLRSHAPPLPSGADPVALAALRARGLQGDYRPHVDLYRPMTASPADQAVTAYALARYSACPEAPEAERNAARAAATEILRALSDVTEGEDPPLESEAAVAASLMALQVLQDPAHPEPLLPEWRAALLTALDRRLGGSAAESDHARAMTLAAAAAVSAAGGPGAPARERVTQALDLAWKTPQPPQLVATAAWLLMAERSLGGLQDPVRSEAIAAKVGPMRDALRAIQAGTADDESSPDLLGGFSLTGTGRSRATAQSARPALALAIMLGNPTLTPDAEVQDALRMQLLALRFLRQLTVDDRSAYAYRDRERSVGGVRTALWDCVQPLPATATTLLALLESEDSMRTAAARARAPGGPGGQPPQPGSTPTAPPAAPAAPAAPSAPTAPAGPAAP